MITTRMRGRQAGAALALSAFILAPSPALAAGFALFEQGAKGMGFAGAFTAQANDASAIFHNPAGLAFLKGKQLYFGGTAVAPRSTFTGEDPFPGTTVTEKGDAGVLVPPNAYYSQHLTERVAVGLGLHVPFGLKSAWQDPATYSGRYISTLAELKGFSLNPTVAVQLADRLSVGGGVDVRFSSVALERRVPVVNPFTLQVVDGAIVRLESDTATGVGLQPRLPGQGQREPLHRRLLSPQGEDRLRGLGCFRPRRHRQLAAGRARVRHPPQRRPADPDLHRVPGLRLGGHGLHSGRLDV